MAELFQNQAKQYADSRPTYPSQLFQFIASKTPSHELAWDIATGSGQAAKSIGEIYKNVIATDASEKQLEFAAKVRNVRYEHTPSSMTMVEIEQKVAREGTLDLVTIAQALHWFDLTALYEQVRMVLKKPKGVIAAWCYDSPRVSDAVDSVFDEEYAIEMKPYEDPKLAMVKNNYRSIEFPFEAVEGCEGTGPFEFEMEKEMRLEDYLMFLRKEWRF